MRHGLSYDAALNRMRVGIGYDIHRFAPGRKLVLGGVEIPAPQGLEGHSDADCVSHAVADAVLGALGLPDIGHWFPNTDSRIEGIDSQQIVSFAAEEAGKRRYRIANIDVVVIAEIPRIAPHIDSMKERLAESLGIAVERVGIKATTHEGLGALGRSEGIAAQAVCLLEPDRNCDAGSHI